MSSVSQDALLLKCFAASKRLETISFHIEIILFKWKLPNVIIDYINEMITVAKWTAFLNKSHEGFCQFDYINIITDPISGSTISPKFVTDPEWSNWGPFSPCTKTCGPGTQLRTRSCNSKGNGKCLGKAKDLKPCRVAECPALLPKCKYW